jgi:DNA-binding HxlR family transcriptional regulator
MAKPTPAQSGSSDVPRFEYDLEGCGLKRALDALGEKWSLLVLREAIYGVSRFDDFGRALRCGRGVLSSRLKSLTRAGILKRQRYLEAGQRSRADYHLTEKGRDLYPAMLALSQWSDRWNPPEGGPVALVLDRHSGQPVRALMTSRADVQPLKLAQVRIEAGPGLRRSVTRDGRRRRAL